MTVMNLADVKNPANLLLRMTERPLPASAESQGATDPISNVLI